MASGCLSIMGCGLMEKALTSCTPSMIISQIITKEITLERRMLRDYQIEISDNAVEKLRKYKIVYLAMQVRS